MGAGAALAAVRKDGSEFPAEISLSALETDQGVIVSAAIRDVTERLDAQAERERLDRPGRTRRRRTAPATRPPAGEPRPARRRRRPRLQQHPRRDRQLHRAAASTPSTRAAAEHRRTWPRARNDLGQITRAAERATRLTKQLLAFGRRDVTQAEVLNLNHVIGDVEQMLRRTLGEHIHLITHLDPRAVAGATPTPARSNRSWSTSPSTPATRCPAAARCPSTPPTPTSTTTTPPDHAPRAGPVRAAPGQRHRHRHAARGHRTRLRAVLHHQAAGRRHRPGPGHRLRHRHRRRRRRAPLLRGRHRHHRHHPAARHRRRRADATDDRCRRRPRTRPAHTATRPILLVEDEDALREVASRILTRAGYHVLAANGGAAGPAPRRSTTPARSTCCSPT